MGDEKHAFWRVVFDVAMRFDAIRTVELVRSTATAPSPSRAVCGGERVFVRARTKSPVSLIFGEVPFHL